MTTDCILVQIKCNSIALILTNLQRIFSQNTIVVCVVFCSKSRMIENQKEKQNSKARAKQFITDSLAQHGATKKTENAKTNFLAAGPLPLFCAQESREKMTREKTPATSLQFSGRAFLLPAALCSFPLLNHPAIWEILSRSAAALFVSPCGLNQQQAFASTLSCKHAQGPLFSKSYQNRLN